MNIELRTMTCPYGLLVGTKAQSLLRRHLGAIKLVQGSRDRIKCHDPAVKKELQLTNHVLRSHAAMPGAYPSSS